MKKLLYFTLVTCLLSVMMGCGSNGNSDQQENHNNYENHENHGK